MNRKMVAPVLALLLAVTPVTVHAQDYMGKDGWTVTFDGKGMTSTFKNAEIDDAVYALEPGDTVELHLSLTNGDSNSSDWYMTNEVLNSLEDAKSVAEGGAYTYVLTYIRPDGTKNVLYDSTQVGGETKSASGQGLHQATGSLKNYFYLDQLEAGKSGQITLKVGLEGETQGNAYQNTLAKLQMNFAVEKRTGHSDSKKNNNSSENSNGGGSSDGGNGGSPNGVQSLISSVLPTGYVQTGDQSPILFYTVLALIAGLVCAGAAFYSMRLQKKKETDETQEED